MINRHIRIQQIKEWLHRKQKKLSYKRPKLFLNKNAKYV